ncbi:MAG: MerR family DNA-binding transcriptional regulator [Parcubacteria group bacterium]|nr:MerR family DNA-binding transcriptional regulator [Parcubacteria group bacterium]
MQRRYLTIKQAASILGVTTLTLRNWDKAGKLPAYRNPINNYRVYRLDHIEYLIREIEQGRSRRAKRKFDAF